MQPGRRSDDDRLRRLSVDRGVPCRLPVGTGSSLHQTAGRPCGIPSNTESTRGVSPRSRGNLPTAESVKCDCVTAKTSELARIAYGFHERPTRAGPMALDHPECKARPSLFWSYRPR